MNSSDLNENTLIGVPLATWLAAKRLIAKGSIEDGVEVWLALNSCKPVDEREICRRFSLLAEKEATSK